VLTVFFRHERWQGGAKVSEGTSEIRLRWLEARAREQVLELAAVELEALYGGFDGRPFDAKRR